MTGPRRCSRAAWLLLLLGVAGCHHRARVAVAPPPSLVPMISVPPPTHRTEPLPEIALEDSPSLEVLLPRRPLPRFRPKPTTARQLALLLPPVPAPPPVELGDLTTGGEAENDALRRETAELLRRQHLRLNALPRGTAARHSQQIDQARLFLRDADAAWAKLDVEGARTLATKAKVLLDEL